jgi:hypothetical protein
MREAPLPSEFSELAGRVHYIQRKSAYEFSSSCPKCGGGIHSNGEFSDRFIMLLKSKKNIPFGFCRKCGYKWWQGQKDGREIDPATTALLQQQAREAEERHKEERRIKLAQFSTTELWNELHDRLGVEQREWWRKNGISDDWQDYLKLGYTPDKPYSVREILLHSPAYTIPYFGYGFVFRTMQYRLCNPDNPADRYRFEQGLGTSYYMTTPNRHITDEVIICEGAKKGIVTRIRGESSYDVTVLAVPSKVDWRSCGILDEIKNCGRVYIVFDPDCYEQPPDSNANWTPQPIQFAKEIGDGARIMECSVKIDDAFIHYGLDQKEWSALKKQAIKL